MMKASWIAISLSALALGPACCVSEGALVATPLGPRPIEDLRSGDEVWAVDPSTGRRVATRITAIRSSIRECLALELRSGVLACTPDHPIYCPSSGSYVPAVRFLEGEAHEILRVDDEGTRVERVTAVRTDVGLRRVYDLTVESEHHSFVADGVLVHNKSDDCGPACNGGTEVENTSSTSTAGPADDTSTGSTGASSSSSSETGSSGTGSSSGGSGTGSSGGSSSGGSSGGSSSGGSSGTGSSSGG